MFHSNKIVTELPLYSLSALPNPQKKKKRKNPFIMQSLVHKQGIVYVLCSPPFIELLSILLSYKDTASSLNALFRVTAADIRLHPYNIQTDTSQHVNVSVRHVHFKF